jgi:organic hydroperoxide reductase OsmC/OhrA
MVQRGRKEEHDEIDRERGRRENRGGSGMSDFRFPVAISWPGDRRVVAAVPGKPPIEIATPPEFKGDYPDRWSPEDFLVAAVASCYAVTLVAIAGRADIPLRDLTIIAEGAVGRDGKEPFGFKAIHLRVTAATEPGREDELRNATERTEQGCIVSAALGIPVHLTVVLNTVLDPEPPPPSGSRT